MNYYSKKNKNKDNCDNGDKKEIVGGVGEEESACGGYGKVLSDRLILIIYF